MVVVVLTESEGPAASIPLPAGMDCKDKTSTSAKKLVQARLPFKRLNPGPKENEKAKKIRPSLVPLCLNSEISDDESEQEHPLPPLPCGKALVNGCGPLDGFVTHRSLPARRTITIDLTEDSNSTDAVLQPPVALTAPSIRAPCSPEPESQLSKDTNGISSCETKINMEKPAVVTDLASAAAHHLNGSETDSDTEDAGEMEMSSRNESLLSPSSISSLSVAESSPETAKSAHTTPPSAPKMAAEEKKRHSLKLTTEKRRQREEERLKREQLREEAKAAKEKKREEARKLKEEKEREKREKKERDEKERREKKERDEKEKAERQRAKEEQRKVKQEAKLEEKRKKEEEKRLKEEKERIKAEKSEITRFLQKPKTQQAPKTLAAACGKFAPFEIKDNMVLAPLTRVLCEESVLDDLDKNMAQQDCCLDGLKEWKSQKPRSSGPTWPWDTDTSMDGVVLMESAKPDGLPDRKHYGRMKLLQFHENYRPAYWGTWSKRSTYISPRCPFHQDKDLMDYEVDSDEEWEEEEPGESLSHSEGDDEEEGGEDEDDDDGFFVPHGYLSDGEGALDEEETGDLEKQKVQQKLKAREWDELMAKKKFKVLEPTVKGCFWEGEGPDDEVLLSYAIRLLEPLSKEESSTPDGRSRALQDEQLLAELLSLLHGNVNSSKVITSEFQAYWRQQQAALPSNSSPNSSDTTPARIRLKRLIKQNAVYEKRPTYRRCCWYVHTDVLTRFGKETLPVPCQWSYVTSGAHSTRDDASGLPGSSPVASQGNTSNKRKSAGSMSITKFMKKCAEMEPSETMETDGFQADTEDDDEESDCIIIETPPGVETSASPHAAHKESAEQMEVTPSEPAVLSLPCHTPTPATA